jgi:hypothetical protein
MTDTDLRTAAAAFEADLSEYCDGPLRDALRAALAQSEHNKKVDDWGATLPPQSDGWHRLPEGWNFVASLTISTHSTPRKVGAAPPPPEDHARLHRRYRGASDGPALKCPNPDCRDGLIQVILYDGTPDVETCEDCHGTGEQGLKCPNPDCHKGVIHYGSDADGWEHFQCETCHGTGEMP